MTSAPPRPEPIRVVPSASSHCLVEPPPGVPATVAGLSELPDGSAVTQAQVEDLAAYTVELLEYARRAFELCGSTSTATPR